MTEPMINPVNRPGDKNLGKLFNGGKVMKRREWRGFKDTMYDFFRWLKIWGILINVSMGKGFVKALFRYRWLANYLAVPHMIDKNTLGQRGETLRITRTAIDFVVKEMAQIVKDNNRADIRCGNDKKLSNRSVLCDENGMTAFMMGFPTLNSAQREVVTLFSANLINQNCATHYIDVAQQYGIPGDVCPMPETELGISIEDDFAVFGKCAVQINTTCDGSMMGNGLIAKRLEREYHIPTFQLAAPIRFKNDDVQAYAAEDIKKAIAFVEEHTGAKWDWDYYFECAKRVNITTRNRWEWLDVNSTDYPQFVGSVFCLYNDTNYMGNCGKSAVFPTIDAKIMQLVKKGLENKTMLGQQYRHRCLVWGVQSHYLFDLLYWMINCWGVVPLSDMLSMVIDREIAEVDTPENREQAYYDMAYLTENMIMRNHTHGGYEALLDEMWKYCEMLGADMIMLWEHIACKALTGMHGIFEEQARERGIHLVWVQHDLCDPRIANRQSIRDQFNLYMRTVMREEPLDPSLEVIDDNNMW